MPRISKSELIRLQKKLRTDKAIGEKYGISCSEMRWIRIKYGIPSTIADNPKRNEKIVALYNKGTPAPAIAKKIEISIPQVYKIIRDAGARMKKAEKRRME